MQNVALLAFSSCSNDWKQATSGHIWGKQCTNVTNAAQIYSLGDFSQVQTIKTSVESAIMLLRIDDIVSGISKKGKGGGGQPTGTQTEDHDNVSVLICMNAKQKVSSATLTSHDAKLQSGWVS